MLIPTVPAAAASLPVAQVRPAIHKVAQSAPPSLPLILNPDDPPDEYAMVLTGTCLEPTYTDGTIMMFSKSAPYEVGDFCIFFTRPELVAPGRCGSMIKRLVMRPPSWVEFPWRSHPESEIRELVVAEMLNPPRRFSIRCENLLAIHKCLGPVSEEKTYRVERRPSEARERRRSRLRVVS